MPCAHMPSPSHANAAQQYYSGSYSSELLHFLSYSLLQELLVSNSVSNAKEESVLMMETAIPDMTRTRYSQLGTGMVWRSGAHAHALYHAHSM